MIVFDIKVSCTKRPYPSTTCKSVRHAVGMGRTPYLEEHLSSKALEAWQGLCVECEDIDLCEHAARNPLRVKTEYEKRQEREAYLLSAAGGGQVDPSGCGADNYELLLIEDARCKAYERGDWKEVMDISRHLGFREGRSMALRLEKEKRGVYDENT